MRYPASEKLEIIRTVETSPLPVRRTLVQIGIPKSTFYAWLDCQAVSIVMLPPITRDTQVQSFALVAFSSSLKKTSL